MTFILATGNQHKVGEFRAILDRVAHTQGTCEVYAYSDFIEPFEIEEHGKSFSENATIKLKAIYEALSKAYMTEGLDSEKRNIKSIAHISMPVVVLAEDSGICVPVLHNEPGIYSARYAKFKGFSTHSSTHNSEDSENLQCLIREIKAYQNTHNAEIDDNMLEAKEKRYTKIKARQEGLEAYFIAYIAAICTNDFKPSQDVLDSAFSESSLDSEKVAKMDTIMGFEGRLDGFVIDETRGLNGFGYDPIFIPFEGDNTFHKEGEFKTLAEFSLSAKNTLSHRYRAILKCLDAFKDIAKF